jgi:peptidoglycan/LPS O-acetylase OafA/YrhL
MGVLAAAPGRDVGGLLLIYLRSRREIRGSAILANLGKWSYSTYIWHILVISLLKNKLLWMTPYALGLLVVLPMTLMISFISYNLIEVPFLGLRTSYVPPVPNAHGILPSAA